MPAFFGELRDGMRSLAATPGFALTVVAVLAVGIGANSAMFSMVNAVLLQPIPWENPQRLAVLWEVNARQARGRTAPSTANYKDWREQNQVFERMAPFRFVYFNLADSRSEPERVQGMRVSADFFPLIGVKPELGRNFLPEEEQAGRDRVVLLSNGFWHRRYAADPAIVGRSIIIEGESHTVVGVLPEFPMFRVLNRALDIYTPLTLPPAALSREDHSLNVYARLRPGVSAARAQSDMETIARRLASTYPATNRDWTVEVLPLPEAYTSGRRAMLEFLLAAAGFVLLIACANIASLTLARSISRRKDLAIRLALGATRLRIARCLLTESLILALAAGCVGVLLAAGGAMFLDGALTSVGHMNSFRVDRTVLGFTVGISLSASVLFGLGPAIRSSRFQVTDLLASAAGRGSTGWREGSGWLVASEVALATMLLTGAAAASSSTLRALRRDRGLDPHHVLTAQIWLPASRYATAARERYFVDEALARLRAVPGVEAASVVNYPPLGIIGTAVDFEIEGQPAAGQAAAGQTAADQKMIARFRIIDPDFFRTLRLPLLAGRTFLDTDADETRGVAVVSQTFARRFFGGRNALGQRIRPHFPGGGAYWNPISANLPLRIVGIAGDVADHDIGDSSAPQMYLPYAQNPSRIVHVLVRTRGDPHAWTAAVRNVIRAVDADEPIFDVKTLEETTAETFSRQRTFAAMLAAAAALALLLAATGIYALMAWSVARRTREIGIRIAIGAAPADIARMVLQRALAPAMIGVLAGAAGAQALHTLLRAQIADFDRFDPIAVAVPAGILALVATAASIAPALRALRVDPIAALRLE